MAVSAVAPVVPTPEGSPVPEGSTAPEGSPALDTLPDAYDFETDVYDFDAAACRVEHATAALLPDLQMWTALHMRMVERGPLTPKQQQLRYIADAGESLRTRLDELPKALRALAREMAWPPSDEEPAR